MNYSQNIRSNLTRLKYENEILRDNYEKLVQLVVEKQDHTNWYPATVGDFPGIKLKPSYNDLLSEYTNAEATVDKLEMECERLKGMNSSLLNYCRDQQRLLESMVKRDSKMVEIYTNELQQIAKAFSEIKI
jgi:FtsZ-binding cell division protein ZapB